MLHVLIVIFLESEERQFGRQLAAWKIMTQRQDFI